MIFSNEAMFKSVFSIDSVVFGFDEKDLKVLLIERGEEPFLNYLALPGDLVNEDENLEQAANRILEQLTGLHGVFLEQYYAFGAIDRHPLGRVITIAYYALIKTDYLNIKAASFAKNAAWYSVKEIDTLAFDHIEILNKALEQLKQDLKIKPIGFELLPENFTLSELQHLYEAVLDTKLDKRNFRRKILGMGLLEFTGNKQIGVSHRAAHLYHFNPDHYEKLKKSGFHFEV